MYMIPSFLSLCSTFAIGIRPYNSDVCGTYIPLLYKYISYQRSYLQRILYLWSVPKVTMFWWDWTSNSYPTLLVGNPHKDKVTSCLVKKRRQWAYLVWWYQMIAPETSYRQKVTSRRMEPIHWDKHICHMLCTRRRRAACCVCVCVSYMFTMVWRWLVSVKLVTL